MGTKRLRSLVVSLLLGAPVAACGGPSDPAPGPLGRHFEDTFLAQVPLDQRKDEIAAKQAYDIAVLEKAKAEADFNESRVQLDVAKNERDAARLDEKSAQSRAKAAQQSADMTRVSESEKETKGATAAREAADKRYDYIVAYRAWLQRLGRYTAHVAYWREAQYELAQAKLAAANNIAPKGFKLEHYQQQEQERARKASDYKSKVEGEKSKAMSARSKWLAIQGEADKLLGRKSEFPDPLAPDQVKGTNADMGAGGYTLGSGGSETPSDSNQPVQDPTKKPEEPEQSGGGGGEQ
jgi:hypothetical protein